MSTNPLIGASWGAGQQNPNQNANPLPQNLFNLPGNTGQSAFNLPSGGGTQLGNPGNFQNPQGVKETARNVNFDNIIAGQLKNLLAPQFAQLMGQYGGQAGNFFSQLQNLGSPYYQQKQAESFTQGNKANQDASALAQQQVARQGYGFTPSGAGAAVAGGQAQAGAQSLSEQFLQNLFQNEQMQLTGAQGLSGLASLFNPTQLLGGTAAGAPPVISSNFFQNFSDMLKAIGPQASFGGQGGATGGIGG